MDAKIIQKIALKEWASVILALETGQQKILYRKGGIIEKHGEFEIEAREFYLFPTFIHQNKDRLQPQYASLIDKATAKYQPEAKSHLISLHAKIVDIARPENMDNIKALAHRSIWNEAHLVRTWEWKPEKPLYILTVEVEALAEPFVVEDRPEYGGCVSWITL